MCCVLWSAAGVLCVVECGCCAVCCGPRRRAVRDAYARSAMHVHLSSWAQRTKHTPSWIPGERSGSCPLDGTSQDGLSQQLLAASVARIRPGVVGAMYAEMKCRSQDVGCALSVRLLPARSCDGAMGVALVHVRAVLLALGEAGRQVYRCEPANAGRHRTGVACAIPVNNHFRVVQ